MKPETLENRQLLAANIFHNEAMPEDVNQDNQITPLDALTIINQVRRQSVRGFNAAVDDGPTAANANGRMMDVNDDGRITPLDALIIINRLRRDGPGEIQSDRGSDDSSVPSTELKADSSAESPDVVLAWNESFGEILADSQSDQQTPGFASRAMAMLNLAIYDAVGIATDGSNAETFYNYDIRLGRATEVSTEIAASQAAFTVLSGLYPEQKATLDALRAEAILGAATDRITEASLSIGSEIGNTILAIRSSDGSDVIGEYEYADQLGSFQADPLHPDVPAWGPAWGNVDPFAIHSVEEFSPPSTPDLTSDQYADSYNEVLALGGLESVGRTADQTEAGLFWAYDRDGLGTPLALYSDVLLQIAEQQGNTLEENAALFAQASVAMADAAIVAWDTKFGENFWRPVTAIRSGDFDGNGATEGDADWIALGAPNGEDRTGFTPQFPTYISGHATFGGALFGTLQEFYGTDDIAFELASDELEVLLDNPDLQAAYGLDLDDATRSFESLSEAMAENGRSRVYLGIHFDFDDTVGQEVGQAVAASVVGEFALTSTETKENERNQTIRHPSTDRFAAVDEVFRSRRHRGF